MDRRLTAFAVVHAVAAVVHGVPHQTADVVLATWQQVVVAVTVVGPFVAAAVADRRPRRGGVAFAGLMVLSVAFGVAHHWLLAGVDNVENVGAPHHAAFEGTAVVLAVVGVAGAVVAYSRSSR